MKRCFSWGIGCLAGIMLLTPAMSAEVQSLRGAVPLAAPAPMFDKKRQNTSINGFKRQWKLQPPLISHKIDKERISLDENTCLTCHTEETSFLSGAPPAPESHYLDEAGKKLPDISLRRHFCTQCHITQIKTEPLVENVFVPLPIKK